MGSSGQMMPPSKSFKPSSAHEGMGFKRPNLAVKRPNIDTCRSKPRYEWGYMYGRVATLLVTWLGYAYN